jgi:acid phosphatase type 7
LADPVRGIRQFIVGTGGAELYEPTGPPVANSERLESKTRGVLELTLSWSRYAWRYVVASGAEFTDEGSTSCH